MRFKAELYYKDKKIAEGFFKEKGFTLNLPGPEGDTGTIISTSFSIRWKKIDMVKK
jgi:hypothetical protein